MSKKLVLVSMLALILLAFSVLPAAADDPVPEVFVDESREDGNEDGSQENPYNTEIEGVALARALPTGATLTIIHQDGTREVREIPPCIPGQEGAALPQVLVLVALALLATALLFAGWRLRRRALRLEG